MHNEFSYIIEPPTEEDPWFIGSCPEMPEANGQGKTKEEAVESLKSAIALILEYRRDEGTRGIPESALVGTVTVE